MARSTSAHVAAPCTCSRGWAPRAPSSGERYGANTAANTALTDANIDAEVNRYISWPGQALAYKLGELTIRKLRAEAEATLGPRFDQRAFHDRILGLGAVPLTVLEEQMRAFIRQEAAKAPKAG